jgi:tetratricopeptide (TPR) repeat protein
MIFLPPWAAPDQGTAAPDSQANATQVLAHADALIKAGKNDEAIQLLKPLSAQKPEPRGVEAKLGKAYYQNRNFEEAVTHLELAVKEAPDDAESAQLLGLSYSLLGRASQAITFLERVQGSLPNPDPSGFYVLGVNYLGSHQFDKARAAFARMFSVPPESARAHLVLGQMMMHRNLEDQAAPELKQAIAMDPRIPMAHFLLGEVCLFRSRVPDALAEFKAELRSNPISWLAYWRMGDAYSRLERWDDAERALKQAIWLDQTFTGPYLLLGKVELKKGDPALASGFLERTIQMDPNNASAHYLLGTAYQQMGRSQDANREFETSRKLHPDKGS